VNIWPRPYQQPHPPIWVTSMSPGSASEVADRGYTAATFLTGLRGTKAVFEAYRARRADLGDDAVPSDRLAYAALVYVGRTDEEGLAGARKLMWYITANKVPPQFASPPGYLPLPAHVGTLRGQRSPFAFSHLTFEELIESGIVFAGSPDTVATQVERFADYVGGLGHLLIMGQAGFLDHDETTRSMRLFANEVYPRLKEYTPPAWAASA
jgi:alkanesulfonate monooxygenase SsuD/methylene tetrahydromethanopterin reductase-like flavin-dependent oxidoreductase (luciferase family)